MEYRYKCKDAQEQYRLFKLISKFDFVIGYHYVEDFGYGGGKYHSVHGYDVESHFRQWPYTYVNLDRGVMAASGQVSNGMCITLSEFLGVLGVNHNKTTISHDKTLKHIWPPQ
jgi:hypothetical protein